MGRFKRGEEASHEAKSRVEMGHAVKAKEKKDYKED